MLIKMNGVPVDIQQVSQQIGDVTKRIGEAELDFYHHLVPVVNQPLNVDFSYGSHHLISADLNPLNAPQHVWDGFVQASHMIINLF